MIIIYYVLKIYTLIHLHAIYAYKLNSCLILFISGGNQLTLLDIRKDYSKSQIFQDLANMILNSNTWWKLNQLFLLDILSEMFQHFRIQLQTRIAKKRLILLCSVQNYQIGQFCTLYVYFRFVYFQFKLWKKAIPAPSFGIRHSAYMGTREQYLKSSKLDLLLSSQ